MRHPTCKKEEGSKGNSPLNYTSLRSVHDESNGGVVQENSANENAVSPSTDEEVRGEYWKKRRGTGKVKTLLHSKNDVLSSNSLSA